MARAMRQRASALGLVCVLAAGLGGVGRAEEPAPVPVPNPPVAVAPSLPAENLPNERRLTLKHYWTREEISVVYRVGNGYLAEALAEINWFLRDYRCSRFIEMDPKLLDLLYSLQQELQPTAPVQVVSAYRSEGYNASLLRAGRTVDPDSQHTQGKAMDVVFPGVPAERVRAAAEARGIGGVGYYPFSGPVFVHIDTGPQRHWTETDPRVMRAMGVARKRSRVSLDCTLTTDEVLDEISPEQAYAALPPGAASKPHASPASDVGLGGLTGDANVASLQALPGQSTSATIRSASLHQAGDGPACMGGDPLSPLALLPASPKPAGGLKALRGRLQARRMDKQRLKGRLLIARRAAGKRAEREKTASTGEKATRVLPDWEKSAF